MTKTVFLLLSLEEYGFFVPKVNAIQGRAINTAFVGANELSFFH